MEIKADELTVNGVVYVPKGSESGGEAAEVDGLEYVIVRSVGQGVMCGFLVNIDGQRVTLRRARQMWRWSSRFVLPDAAEHGVTDKWENKFSCETSCDVDMLEACGVLRCTKKAMESLRAVVAQEND